MGRYVICDSTRRVDNQRSLSTKLRQQVHEQTNSIQPETTPSFHVVREQTSAMNCWDQCLNEQGKWRGKTGYHNFGLFGVIAIKRRLCHGRLMLSMNIHIACSVMAKEST